MKPFTFLTPTKILFGTRQIEQLALECPADAAERILLVSDPSSGKLSGAMDAVTRLLADRDLFIFDQIMENPTYEIIDEAAKLAREEQVDLVMGIGGGSAMDAAKGIAIACMQEKSIRAYVEGREMEDVPLPIICIPTTAGTGSEVTPFAVFSNTKKEIKVGYASDHIFPIISIVDPQFCHSLPKELAISTGLDALTHAIEAYLSTDYHPLADTLALEALSRVIAHLAQAANKSPESIEQMSYAAMLAGLAITHKSTILLHILAYPLTTYHHLQHGLANAVLLPAVLDFLEKEGQCTNKLVVINDQFKAVGGVRTFLRDLGINTSLQSHGVNPEAFAHYADQTMVKGDIAITPAKIDKQKLIDIYRAAY